MSSIRSTLAVLACTTLTLTACGGGSEDPLEGGSSGDSGGTITVGSANFPEAVLLGEMYAQALEAKDIEVERNLNIGAREAYIKAIEDGSVDLLPEYTGNLLLFYEKSSSETDEDKVYEQLQGALPEELTALEMSEAVDEDAVVVTQETAAKYKLESIEDLAPIADKLVIGGSPEFRERQAGLRGLEDVYGLSFAEFKTLDVAGPLSIEALNSGEVDITQLFTTQSAIESNDFVVLDDPKNIAIPQNVTPLIRTDALTDEIEQTLNAVSAELTTDELAGLVKRLEVDKDSPVDVAADYLKEKGLDG
ncbi:MAG: ABC transporter substrate-binding protein [Actinomycetota bacterium]|nr:ABC transporter substrate-binding protein [Nocardioidaceae bacterium]MDQ3591315.1 ABC transporter substrate-binding protein [Actinomycetota bacterium]